MVKYQLSICRSIGTSQAGYIDSKFGVTEKNTFGYAKSVSAVFSRRKYPNK